MHSRLVVLLFGIGAAGCASELDLRREPNAPPVVFNYNGVRAGSRRFPDYGAVDRRALVEPR